MKLTIRNDTNCKLPLRVIRKAVRTTLRIEHADGAVNVLICSADEIRRLNRQFRSVDKVTDVLSFPDENEGGDIAICAEKVRSQAEEFGHGVERELAYLTVHSVLHLLGYDHVNSRKESRKMRDKTNYIMDRLKLHR